MSSENVRLPSYWGPHWWRVFDIVGDTYSKSPSSHERDAAKRFFYSQQHLLPCKTCRRNYRSILRTHPPQVDSRASMQAWIKLLKREVNKHKAAAAGVKK